MPAEILPFQLYFEPVFMESFVKLSLKEQKAID